MKKILIFIIPLMFSGVCLGYESSGFVKITQLRPVIDGNVFFEVDTTGAMCGSSAFLIKVKDDGSKAVYSTLLSAAMSGKKVKLETWGVCAANGGWGTEVQGIYVQF